MPKLESKAIEIPSSIDLPPTWRWTRLLDLGEISPKNEAEDEREASFIPMSGIPQLHNGKLTLEAANWVNIKKGFTHFANGDVVVAKITPCFENGKAAIIDGLANGIGSGTTELHVFRPIHSDISSAYIYLFLRSPYFAVEGEKNMTGTAGQKRLPTEYFATRALPLPPAKEQARIVAKVDELMALCDTLEQQQQQRRKLQNALRQSTLQAVATATSPHELQTTWNRLADNFGQLFSAPEDIEDLRNLVLDLAVNGHLTERSESDENIERFIERCISAKADKLATGEMKRKVAAATDVEQLDIPIPQHWCTAQLDELFQFIDYRGKTPTKTNSGVVLVTAKNVRPGRLNEEPKEYISEASYKEWMTRGFPREGDLLITTEAPLGNVARINSQPDFALAQRVINLQPFADLNTQCAMYFLMSPTFQNLLELNSSGMTAKGIKASKLKQLALPIPPIEEQTRIVDHVLALMQFCDSWEKQLRDSQKLSERLCIAAISTFTGITTEPNEEPMKAPQTELIAPLRLGQAPDIKAQAPLANLLTRHNGEMSAKDLWQRYGGEIDAFYAQLKTEVAHGWIQEPEVAEMRQVTAERAEA
ncbi:MAG: restriction endonuclease subunit S [Methylicorpusculum sp.]|uniref:restriction endonuclease subunit S n=1 Tax=Methylicorpusculum sp. TaxID=2713644 RepID=UPI002724E7A4|nr:restriction endonuclease subunit S [Methylicorpusculum sp.]MDO8937718.1 restriction endonuclease subunit S [Methylicorpusculum sp.]